MAVLAAAGILGIIASAAVAVDVGQIYAVKNELETTADAAALAAATALPDMRRARSIALDYAAKNMPLDKYGMTVTENDIAFGHWNGDERRLVPTDEQPTAVKVQANFTIDDDAPINMVFARLFGIESFEIASDAVAMSSSAPCIIALEPEKKDAVKLKNSSELTSVGCGLQVNSTDPDALSVEDSSTIATTSTCVSGGAKLKKGSAVKPRANEYCPQAIDPLEGLTGPVVGACDYNNLKVKTQMNLSPGVYCGGIEVDKDGEADLAPGIYVIKDGMLRLENDSIFEGQEVMLYFHGKDSATDFHKKAEISLTAPTTGKYLGILMFQDPDVLDLSTNEKFTEWHHWLSREIKELIGTIYFPEGDIEFHGSETTPTPLNTCNVIIADKIVLEKNSHVVVDVTSNGCQNRLPAAFRRNIALVD